MTMLYGADWSARNDIFFSRFGPDEAKELNADYATVGNTPLHLAVLRNDLRLVVTLLNATAININEKNAKGTRPIHLAVRKATVLSDVWLPRSATIGIINSLLAAGADVNARDESALPTYSGRSFWTQLFSPPAESRRE